MFDPFVVLGIEPTTDHEVIRSAWRSLAKVTHPDVGGTQEQMKILNAALQEAISYADKQPLATSSNMTPHAPQGASKPTVQEFGRSQRVRHDISSFTIDVLPVEGFELLRIAASTLGEVIDEECPYMIEFTLDNLDVQQHRTEWCRCDLVPEAGATMVHLSIGGTRTSIEKVRDEIIRCINEIHF